MDSPILPIVTQYKKYYQSLEPVLQSNTTKNYSTVIFFFLVLSVFGWFAIRPTIQTILYLNREIKDKTEISKKMDEKINALIIANAAYENAYASLTILNEAIPNNPDALSLISTLKNLAGESGASLSAAQVSQVNLASSSADLKNTKSKETTIPVSLTLEGSFQNLSSFIQSTLEIRRLVTIDSMQFSQNQKTKVSSQAAHMPLRLTLKMIGYYQ